MRPRPGRTARAIRALALGLAIASPAAQAARATDPGQVPPLPSGLPDAASAVPLADLPAATAAGFAGAAMVDVGGGCSGVLIQPVASPAPDAPAYVLTNGHCIDILSPNEVRRDEPGRGTVAFGWPGGPLREAADVAMVRWASMKGTDLAVLELDRTLADLVAAGVPAYPIAGTPAPPGAEIAIVGAPAPDDGSVRQLTVATCTLLPPVDLVEDVWSWRGFPADRCAGIRHGSSGSPVLAMPSRVLVALVNTGTDGSEGRSDCMFDRPCEVHGGVAASVEDAVYGPSVAGLGACWDGDGRFAGPGGACPLDPGVGLRVDGTVTVTNPDAVRPDGRPSRTTWGARLSTDDPALAWYRAKTGPLGLVECDDPAGYGESVALAAMPVFDAPLPAAEGRYQLCLLAGPGPVVDERWQQPRFATVLTAWVDRTPPIPVVDLAQTPTDGGWVVEPVVVPPELVTFTWTSGPAATTDCADPTGFRVWRHAPIRLDTTAGPVRICVVGHDPAGNPSPTLDRVLESPTRSPGPTVSPAPIRAASDPGID